MSELVYLACPYSHELSIVRSNRFQAVNYMAFRLLREGILVFSPISHSHPLAVHGLPNGWEFWSRWGGEFLRVCNAMIVLRLDEWERSVGVTAEIEIMRAAGKPVFFVDPGGPIAAIVESLKLI